MRWLTRILVCPLVIAALSMSNSVLGQQQDPRNVGTRERPAARGQQNVSDRSGSVPVNDPAQAVREGVADVPGRPFPELSQQERNYLQQVLGVWEQRTAQIERFECKFTRWQFDPNQHETAPYSIGAGKLKYAAPDKGLFEVEQVQTIADKNEQPEYQVNARRPYGEYWICDGEWVHVLDRNDKKAERIQLPPSMRGEGIHMSPLPFLFGVKAEEIQQRYWIRVIQPPAGSDDVWLEAFPKRADDAGNYSRVQVVLDRSDILPKALIVFLPNWRPEAKHREHYEFTDRQVNNLLDAVKQKVFMKEFISTKLPSDWKVVETPWVPPQDSTAQVGPGSEIENGPQSTQQRTAQPGGSPSAPRNR